jgi:hypothetical protein
MPTRVNPLREDALTIDTIRSGDRIVSWELGWENGVKHLTIMGEAYADGDGNMVVDVRHPDGCVTTELTSTVGLTGQRYTGQWTAIAIRDQEEG